MSTTIKLRSQPLSNLSFEGVKSILEQKGLFDRSQNELGKGVRHQYEAVESSGRTFIIDQATGLMWQRDGSSSDLAPEAARQYVRDMNAQMLGGYNNWRLPTLEEAMSLLETAPKNDLTPDSSWGSLYIDPLFSDATIRYIWTADTNPNGSGWYVCFPDGYCMSDDTPGGTNRVRVVRQTASPTPMQSEPPQWTKAEEKKGFFRSLFGG